MGSQNQHAQDADAPTFGPLRVVVAGGSVLLREGLIRLLDEAGVNVVGAASDGADLLRKVHAHKPDVAIVGAGMPPTQTSEGIEAAIEVRRQLPDVGLLVLSQQVEKRYAFDLFAHDATGVGYLLQDKIANVEHFVDALRRIADGGSVLDPEVVAQLIGRDSAVHPLNALTAREVEVLRLMAEGHANCAIAERLIISRRSVEQHVTQIYGKLELDAASDVHRRVMAAVTYLRCA